MTGDIEQPLPSGFKLVELERVARVITLDDQSFKWTHKDIGPLKLQLDTLPRPEIFSRLLRNVGSDGLLSSKLFRNIVGGQAIRVLARKS